MMQKSKPGFVSGIPRLKHSQINKQILKKCLEVVNTQNEELTPEQMKDALTKIALELRRFQSDSSIELSSGTDNVYKTKLKMKRRQIKNLKENLNTACMVAKTLSSSKEKEYSSINKHLNVSRNETANLLKKNAENMETIQKLNSEKQAFISKLQHLTNFIELGYKELQSIRKEEEKNLPLELQLKEIIMSCGQYYADFCNEHEKCTKLEQKNRFIANKLIILERNLEEASEQLKNCQHRQRSKSRENKNKDKVDAPPIGCVRSEYKLSQDINVARVTIEPVNIFNNRTDRFSKDDFAIDLTSHMTLVKDLMDDQDCMLSELKTLSEELNYLSS